MTPKEMKSAVNRYNRIMNELGYEHNTIGTCLSENTDNWTLRDMVAEMDYTLGVFHEDGNCNGDMRYGEPEERKMWRSYTGKMSRFIEKYAPMITTMRCVSGHCSRFDTK